MADVKATFEEWIGCRFDDFMLLDLPDRLVRAKNILNPCKYLLYNDCFMGIMDSARCGDERRLYTSFARRLNNAAKRTGEYAYLFETAAKLCSALAIKADLGVRTRTAYGDREAMKTVLSDYKVAIKRVELFYLAFRDQWYRESKPQGFDVHELRLGGLLLRMKSARNRLTAYCNGEIDRIPELEEPMMLFPYGFYNVDTDEFDRVNTDFDEEQLARGVGIATYNHWLGTATANLI